MSGMEKRMVLRYRFGRIDIQARSPNDTLVNDFSQGFLHDYPTSSHIHDDGFRFHHPEFFLTDKAGCALIVRSVHGNDIGLAHKVLKRDRRILFGMVCSGSGVIDDFHPKRGSDSGNFWAYRAQTNDTQHLASHFNEWPWIISEQPAAWICPGLHDIVKIGPVAQKVKNMHECFLNNGIRGIAGDIPDNHSMSGTGVHINIVYAGAGLTDKPKFRRRLQQQVIHLYLVHNQNFAITYPADGLLRSRIRPGCQFPYSFNRNQRWRPHRPGIQKHYLHLFRNFPLI